MIEADPSVANWRSKSRRQRCYFFLTEKSDQRKLLYLALEKKQCDKELKRIARLASKKYDSILNKKKVEPIARFHLFIFHFKRLFFVIFFILLVEILIFIIIVRCVIIFLIALTSLLDKLFVVILFV